MSRVGVVRNIWRRLGTELHEYFRVLLHLQQFLIGTLHMVHGNTYLHMYGPHLHSALAPRAEYERLLLTQRLLDPLEAGWQAALSIGDVDGAWAFCTTAAEETLLALACPDITPDSLPAGATLPLAPPHPPCGRVYRPAALRGAPLPQAAPGHRGAAQPPSGVHPGGPGPPPG